MKVLGTWNRVLKSTMKTYPLVADFPKTIVADFSVSLYQVGKFFTPYESTRDVKPRTKEYQWMYPLVADFPRSLPISQSPCIVGYFSSLMKVLGTWNRVQMSTMKVPFGCRFSSIVADFSVSLYSRVFFTPYESTRDVKPRPKSTMKVPFGCRFSSIVADFSVSLV